MANKQTDPIPILGAATRPTGQRQQSSNDRISIAPRARAGAVTTVTFVIVAVGIALVLVASTGNSNLTEVGDAGGTALVIDDPAPEGDVEESALTVPPDGSDAGQRDEDTSTDPGPTSEVSIQVANSTSVDGAAGSQTDALKPGGYILLTPANYVSGALAETKIHHQPGYFLHARQLAETLGIDPDTSVFTMPVSPTADVPDFADPNLLVILGTDVTG